MQVRVFGPITVVRADPPGAVVLGASRVRTLLAVLAAQYPDPVSEGMLTEALWGDDPPRSARTALQTHISALRDRFEPDRPRRHPGHSVSFSPAGYALTVGPDDLDLTRFGRLVATARSAADRGEIDGAIALLDEALECSRGRLFDDLADEPWARGVVARVHDQRGAAFESRFGLDLESGPAVTAIDALQQAAEEFPYRERLTGQLALAHYRRGDQRRALAVLDGIRVRLRDDLGLEPGRELRLLEHAILDQDPNLQFRGDRRPVGPTRRSTRSTAVRLTPMVGRDAEADRVTALLTDHQLVTVTGPSGAGKTTLAAHVAARLADDFDGRVHTVDLTDAADQDVLRAFSARIRVVDHPLVPLADNIVDALGDQPVLLVVETCEVALDAVGRALAALLAAPGLRVLATSQAPLRLRAEHVVRLDPLDLDDAVTILTGGSHPGCGHGTLLGDGPTHDEPMHDDGAFYDRLRSLAERLDRLPLALELAAPHLRTLGVDEVDRLVRAGTGLHSDAADRPGRHRSLDAAVGWSLDLLDPDQHVLLTRLLAHAAPFTARTAAELWGDDPLDTATVTTMLSGLVDRSLVFRLPGPTPRFRLLDGVRRVVAERADPDELDRARARLVDATFAALQALAGGGDPPLTVDDLTDEVLPAADRLVDTTDDRSLYMAAILGSFAIERGVIGEARQIMRRALAGHPDAPALVRGLVWANAGFLAWYQGDLHGARETLAEVERLAATPGYELLLPAARGCSAFVDRRYDEAKAELDAALATLAPQPSARPSKPVMLLTHLAGNAAFYAGDTDAAARHYRAQRDAAERLGDAFNLAQALRFEAVVRSRLGDHETALRWAQRSLGLARDGTDPVGVAQSHGVAAMVAWTAGLHDEAAGHAVAALEASRSHRDVFALRAALPVAAAAALRAGDAERAARLTGWYLDLLDRTGQPHWPSVAALVDSTLEATRAELGPRFAVISARGATQALSRVVHDATGPAGPVRSAGAVDAPVRAGR